MQLSTIFLFHTKADNFGKVKLSSYEDPGSSVKPTSERKFAAWPFDKVFKAKMFPEMLHLTFTFFAPCMDH